MPGAYLTYDIRDSLTPNQGLPNAAFYPLGAQFRP